MQACSNLKLLETFSEPHEVEDINSVSPFSGFQTRDLSPREYSTFWHDLESRWWCQTIFVNVAPQPRKLGKWSNLTCAYCSQISGSTAN